MQHFNQRLGSLELHIGATDQRLCRLENVCDQLLDSSTTLSGQLQDLIQSFQKTSPIRHKAKASFADDPDHQDSLMLGESFN
jgi:hypothetical protein